MNFRLFFEFKNHGQSEQWTLEVDKQYSEDATADNDDGKQNKTRRKSSFFLRLFDGSRRRSRADFPCCLLLTNEKSEKVIPELLREMKKTDLT